MFSSSIRGVRRISWPPHREQGPSGWGQCLGRACKYSDGKSGKGANPEEPLNKIEGIRSIKDVDKLIQKDGVESLSYEKLLQACQERGRHGLLSKKEHQQHMCQQLRNWLDLSLNNSVPASLMILSRSFRPFTVCGKMSLEEAVVVTLSSLPDEVLDGVRTVLQPRGSLSGRGGELDLQKEDKDQEGKDKAGPAGSEAEEPETSRGAKESGTAEDAEEPKTSRAAKESETAEDEASKMSGPASPTGTESEWATAKKLKK